MARAVAREAAEEAGKRLARQGAKQAAKELPPVVIGENMERVTAYASRHGYQTINDFIPPSTWTPDLNKAWIRQMMREGRRVIDIGPHFERRWRRIVGIEAGTPRSKWYEMERRMLRGYAHYEKAFERKGKWSGGVEGLVIPDYLPEPFTPPFLP